jgi:hypothetical protein
MTQNPPVPVSTSGDGPIPAVLSEAGNHPKQLAET